MNQVYRNHIQVSKYHRVTESKKYKTTQQKI